ncbi:MAG: hypothetical protein P1V34_09920 [Alphaproteobacteria bacterium]|nr:hypothetical protein [Alphaproteobacteria bacterium]
MEKLDHDAANLIRDQGVAAVAFAQARALECIYYCDEAGQAYWIAIGCRIKADRARSHNCVTEHGQSL